MANKQSTRRRNTHNNHLAKKGSVPELAKAPRSNPGLVKNNSAQAKNNQISYKLNRTELEFTYQEFTSHLAALRILLEIKNAKKLGNELSKTDFETLNNYFLPISLEFEFANPNNIEQNSQIWQISDDVFQRICYLEGFEFLAKFLPKGNLEFDHETKVKFFSELHIVIDSKLKFLSDAHNTISDVQACQNDLAGLDSKISELDKEIASLKNAPKAKIKFEDKKNKIEKTLESEKEKIQTKLDAFSTLTLGQLKESKNTVLNIKQSINDLGTKIDNKITKLSTSIRAFIKRVTTTRNALTSYKTSIKEFNEKKNALTKHTHGEVPTYKHELSNALDSGKNDIIEDLKEKTKSSLSREITSENERIDISILAADIARGTKDITLNDDQLDSIADVTFSESSASLNTLIANEEKTVKTAEAVKAYEDAKAKYDTALRNIRLDSSLNSNQFTEILDKEYFTPKAEELDTVKSLKLNSSQNLTVTELKALNIKTITAATERYSQQTTEITNFLTKAQENTEITRSALKTLSDTIEKGTAHSNQEASALSEELSIARKQLNDIKQKIDSIYNLSNADLPYLPAESVKDLIYKAQEAIKNSIQLTEKNKLYLSAEELAKKIETSVKDLNSDDQDDQIKLSFLSALKNGLEQKITERSLDASSLDTFSSNFKSFNTFIARSAHWSESHKYLSEDIEKLKNQNPSANSVSILTELSVLEKKLKSIQETISNPTATLYTQMIMDSIDDQLGEVAQGIKILEETVQLLNGLETSIEKLNKENPHFEQQKESFSKISTQILANIPETTQDIKKLKNDIEQTGSSIRSLDRLFNQLKGLSISIQGVDKGIAQQLNLQPDLDEVNQLFKDSTEISSKEIKEIDTKTEALLKKLTLVPKLKALEPFAKKIVDSRTKLFQRVNYFKLNTGSDQTQCGTLLALWKEVEDLYKKAEGEIMTIIQDITNSAGEYDEEQYKSDYNYICSITDQFSARVEGILKFNPTITSSKETENKQTENKKQTRQPFVSTAPSETQKPGESPKVKTRQVEILEPEQLKRPEHRFSDAQAIRTVGFLGSSTSSIKTNEPDVSTEISLDEILKLHYK